MIYMLHASCCYALATVFLSSVGGFAVIEVYFLNCTSLFYDTVYQRGLRFSFFDLLFAGFLAFFDFFAARLPAAAGFAAADFFPSARPWTCRRWRRVADNVVWIAGMHRPPWCGGCESSGACLDKIVYWRPRAILSHGY